MALKDKFLNGRGLYSLIDKIKNFVKANQQTSGGEANLTSLEVNGTNYKVPQETTANPTLAGNETVLSGVEIEGTKYSLPYLPTDGSGSMSGALKFSSIYPTIEDSGGLKFLSGRWNSTAGRREVWLGHILTDVFIHTRGADIVHERGAVEYNILDGYNTGINPTLSGTEAQMSSIRLNNILYKVLPSVTSVDAGKFLRVDSNGAWIADTVPSAENQSF